MPAKKKKGKKGKGGKKKKKDGNERVNDFSIFIWY